MQAPSPKTKRLITNLVANIKDTDTTFLWEVTIWAARLPGFNKRPTPPKRLTPYDVRRWVQELVKLNT